MLMRNSACKRIDMRPGGPIFAHFHGFSFKAGASNLYPSARLPAPKLDNDWSPPMTHIRRSFLALLLASSLSAPAFAQCTPTLTSVDGVLVSIMTPVTDELARREFAEISDDLATDLGITAGDIDADPEAPNPQIRVRIQTSPNNSGISSNNAVFTVTAIRTVSGTDRRIWIYDQNSGSDKNSGEFKIFATSTGSLYAHADANADDIVDDVTLRAYTIPVSSTSFTNSAGTTTVTTHYCEPSTSQNYLEIASREADDQVVVLAPHGGNIETGTSLQVTRFAAELETINSTPVNVWNIEGKWGNNQTFERWHITSTSLDTASYPGLADLLPAGGTFDFAVSFHGFGGTSSSNCVTGTYASTSRTFYQIILGGGAERNLKCAIALAIGDEMVAASRTDDIAIAIRDDVEGDLSVVDYCGRSVSQSGLSGTHVDNIVNRLAAVGGIQLEQSKTVRDDATLRNLVADGVAEGLADFMADDTVDYCNGL